MNFTTASRRAVVVLATVLFMISINFLIRRTGTEFATAASEETMTNASETNEDQKSESKNKKSQGPSRVSKDQLFQCEKKDDSGEEEGEEEQRWSDRSLPTSSAVSLFNCDLPDALCNYYYPANFFDEECGLGKEFAHFVREAESKRLNGTLWNFMPSIGFPTLTMDNVCMEEGVTPVKQRLRGQNKLSEKVLTNIGKRTNEDTGETCMTERLSFLHVHKAGGTSLHSAFNHINSFPNTTLARHKFFTPSRKPGTAINENRIYSLAQESLRHATKYPSSEFAPQEHVVFAAVRDPVERFISSIGQAMGANGSGHNGIAPVLKEECIKSTSRETLTCLAKYVRDHGFWIELHFTPQVIDISFTTLGTDVPIAMFSFKELTTILDNFGRPKAHGRDGSTDNYRTSPVLRNMTVADYDEESLQIVCQIYEMDVRMQRSLGMEVPRCDPFVPKKFNVQN